MSLSKILFAVKTVLCAAFVLAQTVGCTPPSGDSATTAPSPANDNTSTSPALRVNGAIIFAETNVSATTSASVEIENTTTNKVVNVNYAALNEPFTAQSSCTAEIASNSKCSITITFSPKSAGQFSDSLVITYANPNAPLSDPPARLSVAFSAFAKEETSDGNKQENSANLVTISILNTPEFGVAGTSVTTQLKITGPSAHESSILNLNVDSPAEIKNNNCTGTLAPGAECTFEINSICSSSTISSTLTAQYSVNGESKVATKSTTTICKSAAALAFNNPDQSGDTEFGNHKDLNFTLTNNGGVNATALTFSVTSPFTIQSNSCTATLSPNTSCNVTVRYLSRGNETAAGALTVTSHNGVASNSVTKNISLTGTAAAATISALHPGPSSGKWHQYIGFSDSSKDHWHRPDTVGSGIARIHAGSLRKIVAPLLDSCTDTAISDSINAFDWQCLVESGSTVFYGRLKEGKKLADLIDATPAWKAIGATITKSGKTVYAASATALWSESVANLPDSSTGQTALPASNRIYVAANNMTGKGYIATGLSNIGIVTLNGAIINLDGTTGNCTTTGVNGPNLAVLFCIGSSTNVWIEGHFDGSQVTGTSSGGLILGSSVADATIKDASFARFKSVGIYVNSATGSILQNVRVSGTRDTAAVNSLYHWGIRINTMSLVRNLVTSNNAEIGLNANTVIFGTGIISAGNRIGIRLASSGVYSNITTANNSVAGISVDSSSSANITLFSSLNDEIGVKLLGGSPKFVGASIVGSTTEIDIDGGSTAPIFEKYLIMDSTAVCSATSGAIGVDHSTCTTTGTNASSTYSNGSSTAVLYTDANPSNIIYGKLGENDMANNSDSFTGKATFDSLTDWHNFTYWHYAWGKDGSGGYPSAGDQKGPCVTTETCTIYRFDMAASFPRLAAKSHNGSANNSEITTATCPSHLDGNEVFATSRLRNAIEILGDAIGNEDGFCESNETCQYAPNIGAYQGRSDWNASSCQINNGTVSNVTIRWRTF